MDKKITVLNKVLIILCFVLIAILNYIFSSPGIGTPECKHDILVGILELVSRWLEYIGLAVGIIIIIVSKYRNKNYYDCMKTIIIVGLIIPFILTTCAYVINMNDHNNGSCSIVKIHWKTIETN